VTVATTFGPSWSRLMTGFSTHLVSKGDRFQRPLLGADRALASTTSKDRSWDGADAEQVRAEWRLWVGNGGSSPEERGSANRTRAVGGVKSVSRFELQGKTHEASTYAQTGVNADGGTLDGPIGSRR
jgi:hypothetical protein